MKKAGVGHLLILLIIGSCDQVKDLTTIDFNSTVEFPIQITESTVGNNIQYSDDWVLDAANEDPEIQKYGSKIENIMVEELSFSITNYTTDIQEEIYLTNGSFGFGKSSASSAAASCDVDNLPITHWAGTGPFDFDECNSTLNKIGEALSADRSVRIFMEGTLTKGPLSFILNVKMKLKVTAQPL